MKKSLFIYLTLLVLCLSLCLSCQRKSQSAQNAVYYWRTNFRLDSYERDFLKAHNVTKMYVRFFDVEKDYDYENLPVPTGTLIFIDSVPEGVEIVPTVFITPHAIAEYPKFKDKLYQRICAMAEVNGVTFNEVQIDCDWTQEEADFYFAFMSEFRALLKEKGIKLSTTIRFSQLSSRVPDADYGVLMCYNTGNFKEWEEDNSILDIDDVTPYMSSLKKFKLPLAVAYPNFSWNLVFSSDKDFNEILYSEPDFSDAKKFKKIDDNRYEIVHEKTRDDYDPYYWDAYIRHEMPTAKEILQVKEMVEKNISDHLPQNIIYHLDSKNLSNYSENDVEKIYR